MEEKTEKFDKKKYKSEWQRLHKKQFKVDLNIKEYYDLEKLLLNNHLTKAQFLRDAIEELKKK